MPTPRNKQICLKATPYYHCISRCVRRAYLCGQDIASDRSYEHRRGWIEKRLLFLAKVFCIDVCAYAVMSNHCHVVLHVDEDKSAKLSDLEVVERWHKLCKGTLITQSYVKNEPVAEYARDSLEKTIATYRKRLSDISWFMRLLNEPIARMANAEDECTGRFWEGRFISQALLDESALIACMAYVDLNPVRAGISDKPSNSEYTSIKRRVKAALNRSSIKPLLPFKGQLGSNSETYLPLRMDDYIDLLEISASAIVNENHQVISYKPPNALKSLNLTPLNWFLLSTKFNTYFKGAVGTIDSLTKHSEIQKRMRRLNIGISKRLLG
ncbi:transposase [Thalassotalea sp. PS06]|uniref:transposase n=1 Tax=Thalassotalea sp. PS06 TaxID=2594005 RepID=UPI001164D093|nr:transposase [Thalassotalea sp. PS06]QDP02638.1 transposase [Thalassotalea sp. PS06]